MSNLADIGYDLLATGYTSQIHRIHNSDKVVKVLIDDEQREYDAKLFFEAERAVYERLWQDPDRDPPPQSVLRYFGPDPTFPTGLTLELASKGNFWDHVFHNHPIASDLAVQWAKQAAQGLAFIHKCGVLHRDIHAINMFLDDELNVKMGDFGASSIDGGTGLLRYRETHQLWVADEKGNGCRTEISVRSEIVALGSSLYFIVTGQDLFEVELRLDQDEEIQYRMQRRMLPSTENLRVLGEVTKNCWNLKYQQMEDVVKDVDRLYPQELTNLPTAINSI